MQQEDRAFWKFIRAVPEEEVIFNNRTKSADALRLLSKFQMLKGRRMQHGFRAPTRHVRSSLTFGEISEMT